ncbi:hypothetical protein [Chondromyces crocatus]|uniref:PBS lyase n=1 Tax=Chondromyces crocatus TaxID=52 RepID=A0A0K1ETD5_CHOCO|nr:hypothetical protein [Chondromyces crocatus]AKT44111.1 uncharacterized protein CMC5_083510 [Chondromyces crocatus]
MSVPHHAIRETQDRSWTLRLLERLRLPDLDGDERGAISETLAQLQDPRATAPLTAIVESRELPAALREDAGRLLRDTGNPPPSAKLHAWWTEGDIILQRHALLSMDHADADVVERVARDPAHPLHREAILVMEWGFEEPRFQALKIAALGHPDPLVRASAASVLHWDEPVSAEEALLRAITDPVVDVAVEALRTLYYYPSRRCLRAVAPLRDHQDDRIRDDAGQCVMEIARAFRLALQDASPDERTFLTSWMEPVRELVDLPDEDPETPEPFMAIEPTSVPVPYTADEIIALYADPDGPWAEKLDRLRKRGAAVPCAADRSRLVSFFLGHADPAIREHAAAIFSRWNDVPALLELCRDPAFLVRKCAMYEVGQTSPNPDLSAFIWEHLLAAGTTSTHASETLGAYIVHAPRAESVSRLSHLVRADPRESVRRHAVQGLAEFGAAAEIEGLLPLLEDPPRVTWSVHMALLDACKKLSLRPVGLRDLQCVDHVAVQAAIAPFLVR